MPRTSERSETADYLEQAFLVGLIAEAESDMLSLLADPNEPDADLENELLRSNMSQNALHALADLYSEHYLEERRDIPKSGELLSLLLGQWKDHFPDIFRSYVRMDPSCFDDLVSALRDDPVFHNDSNNSQAPIEEQIAIALYRFGHFGNAASTMKVALAFGKGYGTVRLFTRRVMAAICSERFRQSALQWASDEDKERAKAWVEANSCPEWRDGWLMVDGTLVPLFQRPESHGNSFFDRKSNYSLNAQLISTPDLHIIDFGVGMPGSQHDATAWLDTRVPQEHKRLLGEKEWVWADSAYPLRTWCQAPYKKYVFPVFN
ncbi:hypothetical protein PLICRDRAFT_112152 [Plicaturopsis crispa FD-325 SS-3]|uniref:DDE Tnp4 domain-containing protein n=1 Tax=Plicaturopsis crispa FD-325 SS-3 TaxID=944288 RepID=A0A0C9T0Z9_PLICR|nr:hypothetical protein PLICRDRAFT_120229 [Plicaturopsis crispa FD-325 SS-3]KII88027.1 hypothetical protein PLICRDRAFT_112152 [Plicaturopsis crispa FD-325 SS-3]